MNLKRIRYLLKWPIGVAAVLMVLALHVGPALTSAVIWTGGDINPAPFDFSDPFYLANGLDPSKLLARAGNVGTDPADWIPDPNVPDTTRRGIRILNTTGGFDASGNLIYYNVMSMVDKNTFERDSHGNLTERGQAALNIANKYRAFIFPKSNGGNPILSPAPPNRRQDNVFDTRDGYFSNNPLGLWILTFVVYTPKAFTPEGHKILDPIAATNGSDLDGTPILTSASLIDNLADQGLVELRKRPLDGTGPNFPWVV